jgi:hypothetical protein
LGNGLPNVTVSGLQFQPGKPDQLFISTFGRGIWTYDFAAAGLPATAAQIENSLPDPSIPALPRSSRGGAVDGLLLSLLLGGLMGLRRRTVKQGFRQTL